MKGKALLFKNFERASQRMKVHATCGRGTEMFAVNEVKKKLNAEVISQEDGKVFFMSPTDESETGDHHFERGLLKLKTVERVFITCTHIATSEIKGSGKVMFLRRLKEKILDTYKIKEAVSSFRKVQACSREDTEAMLQINSIIEDQCNGKHKESAVHSLGAACLEQPQATSSPCSDSDSLADFTQSSLTKGLYHVKQSGGKLPKVCDCRNSIDDTSEWEKPQRKKSKLDGDVQTTTDSAEMPEQQTPSTNNIVTFRFSVKCAGWCKKWLHPQRLSKECGIRLGHLLGWTVDLHSPMYDIHVHINDDFVTVGVPLTSAPLSKRNYISDYGLRSTVGWIMADLADIQPGDYVLDPMCGKATTLIEAARDIKHATGYIGCDIDGKQLEAATKNLASALVNTDVQLMQADAEALPFRDSSVDKIICDAPFGYKFTVNSELQYFYSKVLAEMERVLVPGGRLVLLTSHYLSSRIAEIFRIRQDSNKKKDHAFVSELHKACDQKDGSIIGVKTLYKMTAGTSRVDWRNQDLDSVSDVTDQNFTESQMIPFKSAGSPVPHLLQDQTAIEQLEKCLMRCSLFAKHYVKLGETHGSIMVFQKQITELSN